MGRAIDAHDAPPAQGLKFPDKVLCHPVFPIDVGALLCEGLPLLYGLQGQAVVLRVRQAPLLQIVPVAGPGAVVLVAYVGAVEHRLRALFLDGAVKVQRLGAGCVSALPVPAELLQDPVVLRVHPQVEPLGRVVGELHKQVPHALVIALLPPLRLVLLDGGIAVDLPVEGDLPRRGLRPGHSGGLLRRVSPAPGQQQERQHRRNSFDTPHRPRLPGHTGPFFSV